MVQLNEATVLSGTVLDTGWPMNPPGKDLALIINSNVNQETYPVPVR